MLYFYHETDNIGIYEIRNRISGKSYIGSGNFKSRWSSHSVKLKADTHQNIHIQNSFNKEYSKCGAHDFLEFHIIEIMMDSTKSDRLVREEYWINKAVKIYGRINVYNSNLHPTNESNIWAKNPEEAKEKIRQKATGRKHTKETRLKLSEVKKGVIPHNKGIKTNKPSWNIGMTGDRSHNFGRKHTIEEIEKISKSNTGRTHSEATKEKNRQAHLGASNQRFGKKHTQETKNKISAKHKGKHYSPQNQFKKGHIPAIKGVGHTPESIEKMRAAKLGVKRPNITGLNSKVSKIIDLSLNPVISPLGVEYYKIEGIAAFCREHGIDGPCTFGSLLNGRRKSWKGWKLKNALTSAK